jgi:hypothetical protein
MTANDHRKHGISGSLAIALALVVPASLVWAAPASAATWNHVWRYMSDNDSSSCITRTITLRGTYRWRAFGYHWAHPLKPAAARTVRLQGRYFWSDCIFSHPGSGKPRYYVHRSLIQNVKTRGQVTLSHPFTAYGDGRYHWGSTIQNVRGR